ncbi:MAG: hypothetical protein JOZ41_04615, partial [Chloroflexi bacterium]|nr:hypothetical protein [Chloroflexota bacterium]
MDVDAQDHHYRALGLPIDAPRGDVEAGVERLSERAATLVYSSPEQSHALWERIRRIREDLLSSDERRAAYDQALRQALSAQTLQDIQATVPVVASPRPEEQRPPTRRVERRERRREGAAWLVAAACIALLLLATGLVLARSGRTPPSGSRSAAGTP